MVALGFSKDTRISILLNSISTEQMKNLYAARGAAFYALNKISSADGKSTAESISDQQISGEGELSITAEEPPTEGISITSGEPPTEGESPTTDDEDKREDNESQGIDGEETDDEKTIKWVPSKSPYSIKVGNIYCDIYLYDENGKLNLNGITDANREIFVNFLVQKGIDILDADVIVDSILDWIDDDDLTHLNGAEDKYYETLPEPYKVKNAPFHSIEELALVRGVTSEIFEDIRDDITVYGDKQISININFASKEILSSVLGLSTDLVDELALYVEENGPIKDSEELRQLFWDLGIIGDSFEDIRPYITINQSNFVTIRSVSKGSKTTQEQQHVSGGYEYKLIAGRSDNKYKVFAVFPE
jgi:general secretion pathway protein K